MNCSGYDASRRAQHGGRLAITCTRKIAQRCALLYPALATREDLLAVREDVIQGILEVRRRLRKLLSDLPHKFLVALLDLFLEQLLQRPIAQSFFLLLREIR